MKTSIKYIDEIKTTFKFSNFDFQKISKENGALILRFLQIMDINKICVFDDSRSFEICGLFESYDQEEVTILFQDDDFTRFVVRANVCNSLHEFIIDLRYSEYEYYIIDVEGYYIVNIDLIIQLIIDRLNINLSEY